MALVTWIALLRGINVSGHHTIPMGPLRDLCTGLGWQAVQSYIQSGNLIFQAHAAVSELESQLEQAIHQQFRFTIPVIVRPAQVWQSYIDECPFPDAVQHAPKQVMLLLSKHSPDPDAAIHLQARAANGEQIRSAGDALWIYYADGVARSKLSPALCDRLIGSAVTARNWRTVCMLHDLSAQSPSLE